MPPPRFRLDPDGYYHRLGLDPAAAQAAIITAYRLKARQLHPDVPGTGNADAFVAVKQAYDVLSDPFRRAAYDRSAREAALDAIQPEILDTNRPATPASVAPLATYRPRFSDLPVAVWAGMAAFLCFCVFETVSHLLAPSLAVRTEIRPNAPNVAPLSQSAHQTVLYGPEPVRLAGTPNFYVLPAGTPAMLWRLDKDRNTLVPLGQLPPFSAVQALRLVRASGMLEVLVNEQGTGFVSADHVKQGNAAAARRAYCSYNAGPTPFDGEFLQRRGFGHGTLHLENRAVQPAVVKLRNAAGAAVLTVFLGPGASASLAGLPEGVYRPDYAIGELWSRACNTFAAGMRARRVDEAIQPGQDSRLVVAAEAEGSLSSEISDQVFDRD